MRQRTAIAVAGLAAGLFSAATGDARATSLRIEFTNNAPAGGNFLTPVWVGFHNGSFDSYDGGVASEPALERIAEDGAVGPISDVFGMNGTLVATGTAQVGSRVQGVLGGGPIAPGTTVMGMFDVAGDGSNRYFSYASMILPSNDYYIANGNPLAHDLQALLAGGVGSTLEFNVGMVNTINDAGTEVNDLNTAAAVGLFPGLNGGVGQTGPNQGADENGVNTNVLGNPFPGVAGFDHLNFNDVSVNPGGLGTLRFTVVPEPSAALLALGGASLLWLRRRRNG